MLLRCLRSGTSRTRPCRLRVRRSRHCRHHSSPSHPSSISPPRRPHRTWRCPCHRRTCSVVATNGFRTGHHRRHCLPDPPTKQRPSLSPPQCPNCSATAVHVQRTSGHQRRDAPRPPQSKTPARHPPMAVAIGRLRTNILNRPMGGTPGGIIRSSRAATSLSWAVGARPTVKVTGHVTTTRRPGGRWRSGARSVNDWITGSSCRRVSYMIHLVYDDD